MSANGTKCSTNEECESGICLDEVCTDKSDSRYQLKRQTDKLNKYRQNITDNENLRDRLQEELNYLLNRARPLIPEIDGNEANIEETHREMRRVNTELRALEEFRRNNPDIDKDEEGNNYYEIDNALSYKMEGFRYNYPIMVEHRNKLVNEYNDMIDKLIPEREELITKIQARLRKRKEKLRRISKEISDDSDVRKKANVEIKKIEEQKENEKKENNQYVGTDEVMMEDIYEKDSYGKCPYCGAVFFNETIDNVCVVATYDGDEDVEDYDYDANPGDAFTNSLFRYEKKCPLCKGSWENFCELSHDERRIVTLDNRRLMSPYLQVPSPSRSSGQSLSPDSPYRNSFTPSPNSVFRSITPTTPEYDLLEVEYHDGSHSGRGRDYLIDRNNNIYSVNTQEYLGQIGEGEFMGRAWENIAVNNPHFTNSRQPGGKKLKSKKKKATKRMKKTKGIKSCCKHTKKDKLCIRKDGKTFSLPRRFSKKKCKKPKGFTMKASCAPYKGCKN